MTVIVQPGTDSNGNPQPMVYDSDTGKVIVDSNGFIVSGGQKLVNIPSKADFVSTPKTQTSGLNEAYIYSKSLAPNTVSIYLFGSNIEISSDVHWDITGSSQGVNIHGISSATITTSNNSAVYLGTNMNVDAVGFDCNVVINQQTNVTLTRNSFINNVYIVAPSTAIQFTDGNYFFRSILYTSSVATTVTSGGGAKIKNLIVTTNTFGTIAPVNFTSNYGASGVSIDDVLLENFVFTSNVGGTFSSSYPPAVILPYVTPNYVVNLRGMSVDTLSSTASFITMVGIYTPSDQSYNVLQANPPASGTVYQNINQYNIRLKIPVTYNPSTTAAATLATGISATSTVTTTTKVSIPSGLTAADGQILTYDMVVPAGWYYELIAANATIGTAEIEAA